jgi:Holliday junction resolvase RusA-like endonuclease
VNVHPAAAASAAQAIEANSAALAHFDVVGHPAPQGDKSAVVIGGQPRLIEGKHPTSRQIHRLWRSAVAERARDIAAALDDAPLDGILHLDVEFRFPMPASRNRRTRDAGRAPKATRPDLDKLIRALGDSLTDGGLVHDDARFTSIYASKIEVVGWTGARIRIGRS